MNAVPIVATVLSVIAGVMAGFASLRQRRTEDAALVVGAQRDHMNLLTAENNDLRTRLHEAEKKIYDQNSQIGDLRVQVAHCDADKERLREEVDELRREVRSNKDRQNGYPPPRRPPYRRPGSRGLGFQQRPADEQDERRDSEERGPGTDS